MEYASFMKNGDEIRKLSYALITQAVAGEEAALAQILKIYEPYHNSLVTYKTVGNDGLIHKMIDEDKKIQVQMHLVEAIQKKWRELI